MWKTGRFPLLVLVALAGCFAAGLCLLFIARFETGDVYPVYSSLRSDPLGVKALYQALEHTPGVSVHRNFRDMKRLDGPENEVVLVLGLTPDFLTHTPSDVAVALENVAQSGARLVLAFQPTRSRPREKTPSTDKEKGDKDPANRESTSPGSDKKDPGPGKTEKAVEHKPLAEKWVISPARLTRAGSTEKEPVRASLKSSEAGLPVAISLRSGVCFDGVRPSWRVLYSVGEKPVIVERLSGKGSIVLVADSYLFSNEAMREERHPALLAWFIGSKSSVVFDEYHLGVMEQAGLMTFARKYRLHGFMAALGLLGLLLVWQRSAPGAPVSDEDATDEADSEGKDHLSGLIHLLRRNIPREDVLKICYDEWRQSAGRETVGMRERMSRVEEILEAEGKKPAKGRDTARVYGTIAEILSRRGQAK